MEIKDLFFPDFDKFLTQKLDPDKEVSNLFFARMYGGGMWGFSINGLYDVKMCGEEEKGDYLQAHFYTHDIGMQGDQIIPNPNRFVWTLKGITRENYEQMCDHIKQSHKELVEAVCGLEKMDNPFLNYRMQFHLEEKEVLDANEC